MARVDGAESAVAALDQLILSDTLPSDTRERLNDSLRPLERFPRFGPEIARLADEKELRFVIGPWPWLILVYLYDEADDLVTVVSPEDGRSATSTIARRRPRLSQSNRSPLATVPTQVQTPISVTVAAADEVCSGQAPDRDEQPLR